MDFLNLFRFSRWSYPLLWALADPLQDPSPQAQQ